VNSDVLVYDVVRTPFGKYGGAQVALGEADVIIVGGVESMSRAPWVLPKPAGLFPAGDATLVSTTLGRRLVNPNMPARWTVSLGEATEQLREREQVTREEQDEFALRSHQAAAAAWDGGFYDDQVVPVPGVDLVRDESIRTDTALEKLAALKPVAAVCIGVGQGLAVVLENVRSSS
jgi:acetyl-CoA acetyltransferase